MRKTKQQSNDQRLTVYLPERAVPGRVVRYLDTGLEAVMERSVPRDDWFHFTLHLQGGVLAGEVRCVAEEERRCRLQFAALSPADRARLEPLMEGDE